MKSEQEIENMLIEFYRLHRKGNDLAPIAIHLLKWVLED